MLPPVVAPGSFAESWSVKFPLINGSNTSCLILPSISFGGLESPTAHPLIRVSDLIIRGQSKALKVWFDSPKKYILIVVLLR
jgi:hypothetical protein